MAPQSNSQLIGNASLAGFKIIPKFLKIFPKLFKMLKVGKVVGAVGSIAAYSFLLSWKFAVIIMVMLFIHESGHVWAMKRRGIKTKGFYFVPLLGGAAVAEETFKTRYNESYIALMGPLWGLYLTLIVFVMYWVTGNPLFASIASWCAMLNLINLLPINPLDGGRIVKSVVFSMKSQIAVFIFIALYILSMYMCSINGLGLFTFVGVIGFFEITGELRSTGSNLVINPIYYFIAVTLKMLFKIAILPLSVLWLFVPTPELNRFQRFLEFYTPESYKKFKDQAFQFNKAYKELETTIIDCVNILESPTSTTQEIKQVITTWQRSSRKQSIADMSSEILRTFMNVMQVFMRIEELYSCSNDFKDQKSEIKQDLLEAWRALEESVGHKPTMRNKYKIASLIAYFGLVIIYFGIMYFLREFPDVMMALDILA